VRADPGHTVARVPEIAERTLELAKEALAEQEREVGELRSRGATMLAAGGVVAGLLGKEAFTGSRPDGLWPWVFTGTALTAAAALIVCVLVLFSPRALSYCPAPAATFHWLRRRDALHQPDVDLHLADLLADLRSANAAQLPTLRVAVRTASLSLAASTLGLGAAAVA
jgi:hypothetical protein